MARPIPAEAPVTIATGTGVVEEEEAIFAVSVFRMLITLDYCIHLRGWSEVLFARYLYEVWT